MDQEFLKIGKTGKVHGLNGEIKISIEDQFWQDLEYIQVLFLPFRSQPLPYFLESLRSGTIAKFEEIDDRESALSLQHKDVFIRTTDLKRALESLIPEETMEYAYLTGFMAHDLHIGKLGPIQAVEQYPQQEMLIILHNENEYLVPANPGMIHKIDEKRKTITLDLPEGLLEI